ncbi:MAG TPA: YaeQ family protein [Kofleriaceae bacterium]|nr:YaeQ family protein [Kofleriaceae bacterium]
MALPATIRKFEIALADADREIYEALDWRVAQHPSESERYLVARVIARALEHAEGVEFSKLGVADDDEPAIVQRDLRGDWQAWIDVGAPSPDRLHKASKLAPRVAVYAWKNAEQLAAAIAERGVHRAGDLVLRVLPVELLDGVAATLDRVNRWDLSVTGGALYLGVGDRQFEATLHQLAIPV